MKTILTLVLLFAAARAQARPYFRLLDPTRIQQSAAMLYDPAGVQNSVGVTEVAIITHSTEDGSILPEKVWGWVPPEDWSPLALGFGGSLRGDAVVSTGFSINVAPQLGATMLGAISADSPPWAQVIKKAFLGQGNGKLRIGWAEVGTVVRSGVFQSAKGAFPGQGPLDILKRAGRIEVGWAWTYGKSSKE